MDILIVSLSWIGVALQVLIAINTVYRAAIITTQNKVWKKSLEEWEKRLEERELLWNIKMSGNRIKEMSASMDRLGNIKNTEPDKTTENGSTKN